MHLCIVPFWPQLTRKEDIPVPDLTSPLQPSQWILNRAARASKNGLADTLFSAEECAGVRALYTSQPGYAPTPLHRLPALAAILGIGELLLKDESSRLGLNAFKIAGVFYAVQRLLAQGSLQPGSVVACATDGNHGRAVAHMARKCGLGAHIFMHEDSVRARVKAIQGEGAEVVLVEGNYDDSVKEATRVAEQNGWVIISDTAWPGYETIPRDIMTGYSMILEEVAAELKNKLADVVLVQAGVGGLVASVACWLKLKYGPQRPFLISCEPHAAACVLESVRAGRRTKVHGKLDSEMAGLSAGEVSLNAWPSIAAGVDACISINDQKAESAMRLLAHPVNGDPAVISGESGACGIAALMSIMQDEDIVSLRRAARLGASSRVLVINTEGATDPENYRRIVGETARVV